MNPPISCLHCVLAWLHHVCALPLLVGLDINFLPSELHLGVSVTCMQIHLYDQVSLLLSVFVCLFVCLVLDIFATVL